jgi:hypothetical protein
MNSDFIIHLSGPFWAGDFTATRSRHRIAGTGIFMISII